MLYARPDIPQDYDGLPDGEAGTFIHVPLAWRSGQARFVTGAGSDTEIEEALKDLQASYRDLPIPDRLLDLVSLSHG